MTTSRLPDNLIGEFFGVGSLGEPDYKKPLEYVRKLSLPYTFQLPSNHQEDMIRQFGVLIDGFEEEGDFLWEPDIHVYHEMIKDTESLLPPFENFPSLYLLKEQDGFHTIKSQITAPLTMGYNIRSHEGKKLVSTYMMPFFEALMRRIAEGIQLHFSDSSDSIILCQDDPSMAFILEDIKRGAIDDLSAKDLINSYESIYPEGLIQAYHYCGDWRVASLQDIHLLWDGSPKIIHIDLLNHPPKIPEEQADKISHFLRSGGALALGVIPNTDDGIKVGVLQDLRENLEYTLRVFEKAGVDTDLIIQNSMVSTQCGLSGASVTLTREVHKVSQRYPEIMHSLTPD